MAKHRSQGSSDDLSKTIAYVTGNLKEHVAKHVSDGANDKVDVTLACDEFEPVGGGEEMKIFVNYFSFYALNVLKSFTQQTI